MTFLFLGLKVRFWYQNCPSILFITLGYIDHLYMYLYIKSKFSEIFLWVSTFNVKLRGEHHVRNYTMYVSFQIPIWFKKLSFFFLFVPLGYIYRSFIEVLIHILKIVRNILMDFKIWRQVSKFDVKLGVVVKNFKIRAGTWLFFLWV